MHLLLAALLLAGAPAGPAAPLAPEPKPATAADVVALVNGAKGRVVLVNAWATWCMPCREEMPDLLKLRKELGPKGLDVVLVSTDFESDVGSARSFLGKLGVDFPTWRKKQADQAFIDGLDPSWSGSLPFTVVFGRDGRRAAGWEGKETYDGLRARVLPLLETKDGTP